MKHLHRQELHERKQRFDADVTCNPELSLKEKQRRWENFLIELQVAAITEDKRWQVTQAEIARDRHDWRQIS